MTTLLRVKTLDDELPSERHTYIAYRPQPEAPPAGSVEADTIADAIGMLLSESAPEGWRRVRVVLSGLGPAIEVSAWTTLDDGTVLPFDPGDLASQAFLDLRVAKYQPDRGTWYRAIVTVGNGQVMVEYDYTIRPYGRSKDGDQNVVGMMLDDQRVFPRPDKMLPYWHPARQQFWFLNERDDPGYRYDAFEEAMWKMVVLEHEDVVAVREAALAQAPDDWQRISVRISGMADQVRVELSTGIGAGPEEPSRALTEACRRLRRPGGPQTAGRQGAWYTAEITLERLFQDSDPRFTVKFDHQARPFTFAQEGTDETRALLLQDHETYPRSPYLLPLWHPARPATRWPRVRGGGIDGEDLPPEQVAAVQRVLDAVRAHLSDHEWESAQVHADAAGPQLTVSLSVTPHVELENRGRLARTSDVAAALRSLRSVMADPERGTWYSFFTFARPDGDPGLTTAVYDEPSASFPPRGVVGQDLYREDHEAFPRSVEHLPSWHPEASRLAFDEPWDGDGA